SDLTGRERKRLHLPETAGLFGHAVQCRRHGFVTPAAAHVRPEGVPEAIREIARVVEVAHARQVGVQCRVTEPEFRLRLAEADREVFGHPQDRKSTRLNSSHVKISYAVFCLKKKNKSK